ncbi:unnamed protein product [Sphagnum balticum]
MVDGSTEGFLTGDPFNSPNTHFVELQDMKDHHNGSSSSSRKEEEEEEKGERPMKKKEKESSKPAAAAAAAPPPPPPPPPPPSVPYYKLFSFADGYDFLLMFLGATGACVHGVAIPIFFVFFGKLINAFGQYYADPEKMSAEVAKNALYFLYLAIVVLISAWLEVACWMQTGERQSARMRISYLQAMLSQDVGFFDTDCTTGEIVSRISSDTLLVQDAISEKAGNYLHYMARFFAGFAVGFSSVWQLTLVTLAVVPLIALAGGAYAVVMIGITSKSQKAYSNAGEIAEEAIAQIRTVYSFVGESKAVRAYKRALETTLKLGKRAGLAKGLGVGCTYGLLFGAWALLLWYASTLVLSKVTNGGQAFTTILNVIISGIALGQAAPNLTTFGKGKAAGYNILEMISRKPLVDRNTDGAILCQVRGQIQLQNVWFSYPSRKDIPVFQNFCLTIPAGKMAAIVGGSGSGKSTVISLIERFYDPCSGEVLLDGFNIKNLELQWLREQIGLVNQEPALFATTAPSMWRLMKLNSPEWPYALLGSLGAIMAGCETPLFALAISHMLVTFYNPNASFVHHEVARICFIFAAATVVTVGIYVLQHFFFGLTGERLTMRIRELMFQSILQQEVGWFDDEANNSSLLAARLATDATMVRAAVGDRMSTILQNLALVITAFCIAFYLQWRVAAVILGTFPLLISAAVGEQLFLKGFGGDLSKAYGRASMVAGEAVGNIRTVAAFCAEEKVLDLFMRELEEPNKQMVMRGQLSGFGYGLSQFCMYSSYGLALWYASTLVREGKAQFGDVLKTFMVLIITAFGVAETLALAPDIVKGSKALSSIFVILDRQTAINPDNPVAEEVTSVSGDIELRHVDFAYPARPDVQLFTDFSLKVKGGRSLALVGASGSGKSSVIALIARFYDPLAGKVMINGKDIRNMKLKSLRRHIGLVSQEPSLFACTIYENIVYGRDGATESEVIEAAKAANAHSFISGLPDGYQTEVGERGVQLSGGQKQRVAIARAVLKDPEILLLDEATSALDAQSEKVVQEALDRLMLGRTTVVVAHRLSTIRNTHSIAVIHEGQIVEQGSHQTLMSKVGGTYAQLISLQQHTGKKATTTPTSLS